MTPVTTSDARSAITKKLAEFRERGLSAEPLVFGDHRRPEGVIIQYEIYRQLEDAIDQLRLEANTELMAEIDLVVANPKLAVEVTRHKHNRP